MPVYVIRVYRPERREIDHVHIRADERLIAEEYAEEMYPTGTIIRRHLKWTPQTARQRVGGTFGS